MDQPLSPGEEQSHRQPGQPAAASRRLDPARVPARRQQPPPELKRRSEDPDEAVDDPIAALIDSNGLWQRMWYPLFRPLWFTLGAALLIAGALFLVRLPIPVHDTGAAERLPLLQWLPARIELTKARQAAKQGAWDDALVHWRWLVDRLRPSQALVSDLAEAARGATNSPLTFTETELVKKTLLPPACTNLQRISLAFSILHDTRRFAPITRCVEAYPSLRPHDYLPYYFQALLHTGEIERFRTHWLARGTPDSFGGKDQTAYLAATVLFGDPTAAAEARAKLKNAAGGTGERSMAANRAIVALSEYWEDRADVSTAFQALRRSGLLSLSDQVSMVSGLLRQGDRNEAMMLAKSFSQKQASPDEVDAPSRILEQLGLRRDAISIINQRLASDDVSELLNLRLLEMLLAEQDWSGLRDFSRRLGNQRRGSDFLSALTVFAEELMPTEDPPLTLASIESIGSALSNAGPLSPTVRFLAELERHRFGSLAAQIAGACEEVFSGTATYWELRQRLAIAARNTFELQYAAKRTLEIDPASLTARADLGLALLIQRREAQSVLKESETALADFPTNAVLRVNQGSALAQLRRWQESLEALNLAPREALSKERQSMANLASLEALVGLGKKPEARNLLKQVDRSTLFPEQTRWLDEVAVAGIAAMQPAD